MSLGIEIGRIDPKITAVDVAKYLGLTVQAIHKRIKLKENEVIEEYKIKVDDGKKVYSKANNRIFFDHRMAKSIINPESNRFLISTAVIKGGVGKTTIAEALAIRLSLYGLKVLCVDLDQQANLTKGLGMAEIAKKVPIMIDLAQDTGLTITDAIVNVIPGLDLLPSRLDNVTLDRYYLLYVKNLELFFKKTFDPVFNNYDVIIFDCPPTLSPVVTASMMASDLIIAPMNPDVYSRDGISIMEKEIKNLKDQFIKNDINLKVLLNKFDAKTTASFYYGTETTENSTISEKLFKSVIRTTQEFPNVKRNGKSIFDTLRKTVAKEDIDTLAIEVMNMMNVQPNYNDYSKNITVEG